MRLSFYTYSYTDRQDLPIVSCLERIAKTGYSGIDESGTYGASADPRSYTPERRRLTRGTAERLKLRIEAVITHAQLTDTLVTATPLDLKGSIDLAADLGANVVTFHLGGAQKDVPEKDLWQKTVNAIKTASAHGAAKHISVAIDGIWPPWLVNTPDLLARLFDDVASEHFGVNFDPCYLTVMGADPIAFAKRFGPKIVHTHLKDSVGKYPDFQHRIPGKGEMNYPPIFQALAEAKFAGSLAVECFVDMKFEEACDEGYKAMTEAMAKVGVELKR